MEDFFRSAEDEMAEFEFMEYGEGGRPNSADTTGITGSGNDKVDGGARSISSSGGLMGDSLFEDEEDHKRNK